MKIPKVVQPKKRREHSSAELQVFVSRDEKIYMTVEPHIHYAEGPGTAKFEGVEVNINGADIDLTVSLPVEAFARLVAIGRRYLKTKTRIVAHPEGSVAEGEMGKSKTLSPESFADPA